MATDPERIDSAFWRGRRVFLTGHTGFKGSWLSLWLQAMGAETLGYALKPPTRPSLFEEAGLAHGMQSVIADVRDGETLLARMRDQQPEVVIHMAAQSLVRQSYREPVATYATNVMGTVNLLEAVRQVASVRAVVIVTTDKCYENREWPWGYREDEPMGGLDPYSSSKGCAELVTSSYRRSFFQHGHAHVASARAGNVIGGGDWADDRLVPDVLRALERREPVVIRNPGATRPWQHVLEPLSGYLTLAQRLAAGDGACVAEAWNFGPRDEDAKPVHWVVERLVSEWGEGAQVRVDAAPQPHEANFLKLDISKARARLGWQPAWSLDTSLRAIAAWHRGWLAGESVRTLCLSEINRYQESRNALI